ncbi:MAG TPA: hypothetical protein VG297_20190, partial [Bryobacteraceae bacterium]|nr:hypothetical protein [Bryobacteraceae bacterium]
VNQLAGARSQPSKERQASRWGSERGYCVMMGQKVPIERPRVRSTDNREMRLGSYEMFHRGEPLTESVWEKLMLGLTTRKYGEAVREFTEAYGIEKSAVSGCPPVTGWLVVAQHPRRRDVSPLNPVRKRRRRSDTLCPRSDTHCQRRIPTFPWDLQL